MCLRAKKIFTSFDLTLAQSSSKSATVSMETYKRECCVQVHHVYKDMWEAVISEEFKCKREPVDYITIA